MYSLGARIITCTSLVAALDVSDRRKQADKILHANSGQQDLAFFHIPMNFGNSVALTAAVGSGSTLSYSDVTQAAQQGWDTVRSMVLPNAPVWGPLNPDLQVQSELGYPMYYTPQNLWPKDLAERYFGSKKVFGILRDPYERIVATFRGPVGGTARGWSFTPDGLTCADELNKYVKEQLTPLVLNPSMSPQNPNLHVQATYFEGPYGVTLPLDLDTFPLSANVVLQEHGYDVTIGTNDMMHIKGCDDTWAGDLDDEAKGLIKQYYAPDFQLRCKYFGYCDESPSHCLVHVPGMCPTKMYTWDDASSTYVKH